MTVSVKQQQESNNQTTNISTLTNNSKTKKVWDAIGSGQISFAREQGRPLGYIVENKLITTALLDCLTERPNVNVIAPASVGVYAVPSSNINDIGGCD